MFFLDTNICVAFLNGNLSVKGHFLANEGQLAVSSIVAAELYYGFKASARAADNLPKLEAFLSSVHFVEFDVESARAYGEIQTRLRKSGQPAPAVDAMIGAVALSRGGTFVTHDKRGFPRIPGLKIEDWME
ncbi:MAG: type II toxin-antitoxin system VapC family toxin [Nitrospirae bacterium]|nr:type II toxin-antitoxin system VapC family toxin [Nitrospirota bacterium]